jgi:hypothetical protein
MLFIMYRKYKAHRRSLIKAFYRDGIGYFVVLSGRLLSLCAVSQGNNEPPALALANVIINFAPGLRVSLIDISRICLLYSLNVIRYHPFIRSCFGSTSSRTTFIIEVMGTLILHYVFLDPKPPSMPFFRPGCYCISGLLEIASAIRGVLLITRPVAVTQWITVVWKFQLYDLLKIGR